MNTSRLRLIKVIKMRKLFSKTMLVCVFVICFAFCAYGAEKASVDTSSLSKGLIGVKYTGGSGKGRFYSLTIVRFSFVILLAAKGWDGFRPTL